MSKRRRRKNRGKRPSPSHISQKRILGQTYVYLMHNFPYVWKSKFGITDYEGRRLQDVDESTDGIVFYLMPPVQLPFGWQSEQFVHSVYSWANAPFEEGSGRSEWFVNINPIIGALTFYLSIRYDFTLTWWAYLVLVFSPVIWLDGLFWLLFFAAFWYIVAIFGLIAAYYFTFN